MDLDPPLPRGNLFLSPTSSVRSAKCEVLRSFARGEREKEKEREMDTGKHNY